MNTKTIVVYNEDYYIDINKYNQNIKRNHE